MSNLLTVLIVVVACFGSLFALALSFVTPYAAGAIAALGFLLGFIGSSIGADGLMYFGVGMVVWAFIATTVSSAINESYWG